MQTDIYVNPLITRYASREMAANFSDDAKFRLWRRLWIALARSEKALGLGITDEQIAEMEKYKDDINYEDAAKFEKEVRHDVMAHVKAYGKQAPKAMPIIHLGATSCFVTDNAEVIIIDRALDIVLAKLVNVMDKLKKFALQYKDLPTLGFTHLQPAHHNGRKTRFPVAGRSRNGLRIVGQPQEERQTARCQGHYRHAGKFP